MAIQDKDQRRVSSTAIATFAHDATIAAGESQSLPGTMQPPGA
jgi:hypothetical protein